MVQVAAYHRPQDLDGAIELLAGANRAVLAGGTVLNADREPPAIELVDLQAAGLDGLSADGGHLRIGAMVTLDRLADHRDTPAWLAGLARAELPSTLRTVATVGGTVAAGGGESILLAGLLAAGAVIEVAGVGQPPAGATVALAELLERGVDPGAVITTITIETGGRASVAGTARTPADVPIVAAVAVEGADGARRLALTGVGTSPALVDPGDPSAGLDPPADFRGSAGYRRHLASILSARAIGGLT